MEYLAHTARLGMEEAGIVSVPCFDALMTGAISGHIQATIKRVAHRNLAVIESTIWFTWNIKRRGWNAILCYFLFQLWDGIQWRMLSITGEKFYSSLWRTVSEGQRTWLVLKWSWENLWVFFNGVLLIWCFSSCLLRSRSSPSHTRHPLKELKRPSRKKQQRTKGEKDELNF